MKIEQAAIQNTPQANTRVNDSQTTRPGRSHIQRDMKHLARDVRHQIKDEVSDLKIGGDADSEKGTAVREAYGDFKSSLQDVFHRAGKGNDFNATLVPEGLAEAMRSFTEVLNGINGAVEEPAVEVEAGVVLNRLV